MTDNYPELEAAVEKAEERMNRGGFAQFDAEVGTHTDGPAIDVQRVDRGDEPEAYDHAGHEFMAAAHGCGYVVSNVKVMADMDSMKNHTRLFLRTPEDAALDALVRDEAAEEAEARGFLAGLFMGATVAEVDALIEDEAVGGPEAWAEYVRANEEATDEEATDEDVEYAVTLDEGSEPEPLDAGEAMEYLDARNDFMGAVVYHDGPDADLWVSAPETDPDDVHLPTGWEVSAIGRTTGIGFAPE